MIFFIDALARDRYRLPVTFVLLLVVSILTILAVTITTALHCLYGLSPSLNTTLNSVLAVLWLVAFGLLSWWSSATLNHVCNAESWESGLGISVCRLYKALFSFALLSSLATLLALLLDIRTQRKSSTRGVFQHVDTLDKDSTARGHAGIRDVDVNSNPVALREERAVRAAGYALPGEQFTYEDTAYHGASLRELE